MLNGNLHPENGDLFSSIVAFHRILRKNDVSVTTRNLIDALKSLSYIDIRKKEDFKQAIKANFTSRKKDIEIFDRLFDIFFLDQKKSRIR
jgi:uncharacterized protein with von Willebrand factor type A (vWA) domain